MKKVAFDVKGTLTGVSSKKVCKLFKWFESKGCMMFVWSNMYSFAIDAVEEFDINADPLGKREKNRDDDETYITENYMDIAVDDDPYQTWLAAHNFIWVHDIPDDESKFEEKYGHLLK